MQESFIQMSQSIHQASLDLLKKVSETNQSSFDALLQDQFSLTAWGKLAKASLDAARSINEVGSASFNHLARNEARVQELDTVASNIEGLGDIVASLATSLTQLQVSAFNTFIGGYAGALRSLKNAASADEVLATHLHLQAELQDKLKSTTLEALQTFNSLNSGLTAWVESSVEKLAEDKTAGAVSEDA